MKLSPIAAQQAKFSLATRRRRDWLLRPQTTHRQRVVAACKGSQSSDPYDVLGVARGSSGPEVRAAYVRLVKKLHPDVNRTDTTEAAARLNAAYTAVMEVLDREQNGCKEDVALDAFDQSEAVPIELFVNPFACYGANPLQWRELQEVAGSRPGDPESALRSAGAAPGEGAVLYLTPQQLRLAVEELEGMGMDAFSIEVCASYLSNCLYRARVANNRFPSAADRR